MGGSSRLFALIVGIDKYDGVGNLTQAARDACNIHIFLTDWCKKRELTYQPLLLTDEAARRNALIRGFREHLGQARTEDLVLFYFAGHGSREAVPAELCTPGSEGFSETILAVDSRTAGVPEICDKELRYLIHQLWQQGPHILCLFDCCHSGTNTRLPFTARRVPDRNAPRPWDQYVFSEQYPTIEAFRAAGELSSALPEGEHVQLAACQKGELAFEIAGEGGVFTGVLLEMLRSVEGRISYYALRNGLKHRIDRRRFPQTPQIYVRGSEQHKFRSFLTADRALRGASVNVFWDATRERWAMDAGAIHGISKHPGVEPYRLDIYDQGEQLLAQAFPDLVNFATTVLAAGKWSASLNTARIYQAQLPDRIYRRIALFLDDGSGRLVPDLMPLSGLHGLPGVNWVDREDRARYVIRLETDGYIRITPPLDQRSIVGPLAPENINLLLAYIRQMVQWEQVRVLTSAQSTADNPIVLEVFDAAYNPLPVREQIVTSEYESAPDGSFSAACYLKIANNSQRDLFFSLVGLTHQFGIYTNWLGEQMVKVRGGESITQKLPFVLPAYIQRDAWPYSPTWLKVFAAESEADMSLIAREELPEPYRPLQHKGIGIDKRLPENLQWQQWYTAGLECRLRNPSLE